MHFFSRITENSGLTLAIETSGRTGSVAIGTAGSCLAEQSFTGYMKHSAELFAAIDELLAKTQACRSDIRQLFITAGPGSFTGLRIAVTAAKMFHFALKTPIVVLDSLDVIAENASNCIRQSGCPMDHIAVVLDAKKDCFFAAAYDRTPSGWHKSLPTSMMTAAELLDKVRHNTKVSILGEGLLYHKRAFDAPFIHCLPSQYWPPQARNLFRLGQLKAQENAYADPVALTPFYIRPPDAAIKSRE